MSNEFPSVEQGKPARLETGPVSALPKSVTLEAIKNNPDFVGKIAEKIAEEKRYDALPFENFRNNRKPAFDTSIDFGEGVGVVSLEAIKFYVAWELRCVDFNEEQKVAERYLELLGEGKLTEAEEYAQTKKGVMSPLMTEGVNALPSIIPGAPERVQGFVSLKEYENEYWKPGFNNNQTNKINFIGRPERLNFSGDQETFVENPNKFGRLDQESVQVMRSAFEGRTIIDLGAGAEASGLAMVDFFGAKNYIGVEPFSAGNLLNVADGYIENGYIRNVKKLHIAPTDMLTFLKAMPSNIENITILISGVDGDILMRLPTPAGQGKSSWDWEKPEDRNYVQDVQREIERVLGDNSYVVEHESILPLPLESIKQGKYEEKKLKSSFSVTDVPTIYRKLPTKI